VPLRVDTAAGPVVGRRLAWRGRAIDEFLGVPYAAPPLGPNRWRPPQPLDSWTTPRNATSMPPACPQNPPQSHVRAPPFPDQEPLAPWSEDCLVVNVWAPSNRSRLLPVLLWLYGGGWQEGDAAQPLYNGRNLTAAQDVVLVVVNWRVNAFGFLGTEALAAEEIKLSGQATTGFYGQQDQRAALVWARENIEKFGGDKEKVTLWGQSAGASSICYHLLLPRSRGLFQRAIVDSSCDEFSLSSGARPVLASAPYGIAHHWGCAETNLTCLRNIPAAELNAFVNVDYRHSPMIRQKWFYPLWDRSEFPPGSTSMIELWNGGNFTSRVPCMFGSTLEEQGWEFCGDECRGEVHLTGHTTTLYIHSDREGCLETQTPSCKIRHTYTVYILTGRGVCIVGETVQYQRTSERIRARVPRGAGGAGIVGTVGGTRDTLRTGHAEGRQPGAGAGHAAD
jgi:para-nitrobenzyl esterase